MRNRIYYAVAGFLLGATGGAATANTDPANQVIEVVVKILTDHGLAVTLVLVFVAGTLWLVQFLLTRLIQSKDNEIQRLVVLRDELWDEFLKVKPSSEVEPNR